MSKKFMKGSEEDLLAVLLYDRGSTNFYHHGKEVKTPFFSLGDRKTHFYIDTVSPWSEGSTQNERNIYDRNTGTKGTSTNVSNV